MPDAELKLSRDRIDPISHYSANQFKQLYLYEGLEFTNDDDLKKFQAAESEIIEALKAVSE